MLSGKLKIPKKDLNLKMMLCGGQSFRWQETGTNEWTGVFKNCVWTLKQSLENIEYSVLPPNTMEVVKSSIFDDMLFDYLRLNFDLNKHYKAWEAADQHFKKVSEAYSGIRLLNQDPVENLFSFICSSNNNIIRISKMVEKMCSLYGTEIGELGGKTYYTFPTVIALSEPKVDPTLRANSFGYRSKFIQQAAKKLLSLGGDEWLFNLRKVPYLEAKKELMQLPGIGAKVADCICLMSLDHLEALPVDTHVFQIASQHYLPHLKKYKSVTDKVYNEIGDFFRDLFGLYAGWAHTVLFCADLKAFKEKDATGIPGKKKANKRKLDC